MWILTIFIFASASEIMLRFKKTNFENLIKLQNIVNIFVFSIKIPCQSKESSSFLNILLR